MHIYSGISLHVISLARFYLCPNYLRERQSEIVCVCVCVCVCVFVCFFEYLSTSVDYLTGPPHLAENTTTTKREYFTWIYLLMCKQWCLHWNYLRLYTVILTTNPRDVCTYLFEQITVSACIYLFEHNSLLRSVPGKQTTSFRTPVCK